MSKIWFTSDLHLCHDRDFVWEARGFKNITEMNRAIWKNWRDLVSYDDDVYVLGDLMLNDNDTAIALIKTLPGKIHVILGNHDTPARIDLYRSCPNIVEVEYGKPFKYKGYNFFLSHYPTLTANGDDSKPLNRRVINLCGHTHTEDAFLDWDKGLIYHVEVDAHDNKPVLIDDILEQIKGKID